MRWLRLVGAFFFARFKSKVDPTDTITLEFRVWLTDVDISFANHAALMTIMEMGRIDFMVRTNFFKIASRNKWSIPSKTFNVQFHRPMKMFEKAELFTRISYVDEKWIYSEHKIMRRGKEIATSLVKSTIKKGKETVPTSKIIEALSLRDIPSIKHDLIKSSEIQNQTMNERMIDNWKV